MVLLWVLAATVMAQQRPWRIGVLGGVNYIHLENYGKGYYSDFEPKPGYTFGAFFRYTWGGFLNYSLEPGLQFTESRTEVDLLYITDCLVTIKSIDLPVSFKLGLKLSKIFRPYITGTVYASYVVGSYGSFWEVLDVDHTQPGWHFNRFYCGLAAGMGFDLWKFQVDGRYRWNLNRINSDDYKALRQMGLELTLAFLF